MIFPLLPADVPTLIGEPAADPAEVGISAASQWWCRVALRPKDQGLPRDSVIAHVMPPCEDWTPGDSMITVVHPIGGAGPNVEEVADYAIRLARLSVRLAEAPDDQEANSQLWEHVPAAQRYKVNEWIAKVRETGDWQDAPELIVTRTA